MKRGFTLIELLVVIAIIGSLATLFLPNFMAVRERARDAQRKSDLRTIQKAFEIYKQDQSPESYPAYASGLPTDGSSFSSGGNTYMTHFPKDPLPTYHYVYNTGAGLTYTLCACIENKADPDSTTANCTGVNPLTCPTGKSYVVTEP